MIQSWISVNLWVFHKILPGLYHLYRTKQGCKINCTVCGTIIKIPFIYCHKLIHPKYADVNSRMFYFCWNWRVWLPVPISHVLSPEIIVVLLEKETGELSSRLALWMGDQTAGTKKEPYKSFHWTQNWIVKALLQVHFLSLLEGIHAFMSCENI